MKPGRGVGLERAELGEEISPVSPHLHLSRFFLVGTWQKAAWPRRGAMLRARAVNVPSVACASSTTCRAKAMSSMVPLT